MMPKDDSDIETVTIKRSTYDFLIGRIRFFDDEFEKKAVVQEVVSNSISNPPEILYKKYKVVFNDGKEMFDKITELNNQCNNYINENIELKRKFKELETRVSIIINEKNKKNDDINKIKSMSIIDFIKWRKE